MCAEFSGHAYSHGNCIGGNLVRFLDCLVRFKERKAVIELDVKSVFPVQVTRMLDRRPRRFPKEFFDGVNRFHNLPSRCNSSISLIQFLARYLFFDALHGFNVQPSEESLLRIVNMNMSRGVISDDPFDPITVGEISPIPEGVCFTLSSL